MSLALGSIVLLSFSPLPLSNSYLSLELQRVCLNLNITVYNVVATRESVSFLSGESHHCVRSHITPQR